ncbi:MAG: signal peptidase II [Myxococcota bacterium]|nr:signal peptidase II [Myxococcota bacterium]
MSIVASLRSRKTLVLLPLFTAWLVGDLWTKHWADVTLADPRHPLVLHASEQDVGKPLGDLVARRLGVATAHDAGDAIDHIVRLPPVEAFDPDTRLFDHKGPMGRVRGLYLFWRGAELPPRRLDKTERAQITRWATLADPGVDRKTLKAAIDEELSGITLRQWLKQRLRRLSDEDITQVAANGIHPLRGPNPRVGPETLVKDGDAYLLEWRRIDAMGDWWKWVYAENPGAAFGFMRQVPHLVRDLVFLGLTIIVFLAILVVVIRTEERFWTVNIALVGIVAGAAGNFVDRIRYGYVIDFIDMHLGFMRWPTYNVADIAITVGVILLVGDILFNKSSPLVADDEGKRKA